MASATIIPQSRLKRGLYVSRQWFFVRALNRFEGMRFMWVAGAGIGSWGWEMCYCPGHAHWPIVIGSRMIGLRVRNFYLTAYAGKLKHYYWTDNKLNKLKFWHVGNKNSLRRMAMYPEWPDVIYEGGILDADIIE